MDGRLLVWSLAVGTCLFSFNPPRNPVSMDDYPLSEMRKQSSGYSRTQESNREALSSAFV